MTTSEQCQRVSFSLLSLLSTGKGLRAVWQRRFEFILFHVDLLKKTPRWESELLKKTCWWLIFCQKQIGPSGVTAPIWRSQQPTCNTGRVSKERTEGEVGVRPWRSEHGNYCHSQKCRQKWACLCVYMVARTTVKWVHATGVQCFHPASVAKQRIRKTLTSGPHWRRVPVCLLTQWHRCYKQTTCVFRASLHVCVYWPWKKKKTK